MTRVALISQPLRAEHCLAYIGRAGGDWIILTSSPDRLRALATPASDAEIVEAFPPEQLISAQAMKRGRRYRSLVDWARSGSRIGAWVETVGRSLLPRLRRSAVVSHDDGGLADQKDSLDLRSSTSFALLRDRHAISPISELVVFDLFDLPLALVCADDFGADVLVR